MITNPRIERKKTEITKTEAKLNEVKTKLREQKQELVSLENEEIVALFRRLVLEGLPPTQNMLLITSAWAALAMVLGLLIMKFTQDRFILHI